VNEYGVTFRYEFSPLGDTGVLINITENSESATSRVTRATADFLRKAEQFRFLDVVPAFDNIAVFFRPDDIIISSDKSFFSEAIQDLNGALKSLRLDFCDEGKVVSLPVCYDATFGIDLESIAAQSDLSINQVIEIHSSASYTVGALGFAPGFAYLQGIDQRLNLPRRASPRTRVEAGSVAIASEYTGVYPADLPGGWHVLGRTPVKLFVAGRSLLQVGDQVQFQPISMSDFTKFNRVSSKKL
jgi:inhibitor of KinA